MDNISYFKVSGKITEKFFVEEIYDKESDEVLVLTPQIIRQAQMMQQLRSWYNKPLNVSSWVRALKTNEKYNGNPNSPHLRGMATDIKLPNLSNRQYMNFVAAWQRICSWWGVVGGCSLYDWGIHFDSNSDCYGYTKFRLNDYRVSKAA